jgi:hypothetical protein
MLIRQQPLNVRGQDDQLQDLAKKGAVNLEKLCTLLAPNP